MRFLIFVLLILLVGGTAFLLLWEIPAPIEQQEIDVPRERLNN